MVMAKRFGSNEWFIGSSWLIADTWLWMMTIQGMAIIHAPSNHHQQAINNQLITINHHRTHQLTSVFNHYQPSWLTITTVKSIKPRIGAVHSAQPRGFERPLFRASWVSPVNWRARGRNVGWQTSWEYNSLTDWDHNLSHWVSY